MRIRDIYSHHGEVCRDGRESMRRRQAQQEEERSKVPRLSAIRVGVEEVRGGMVAARAQQEDPSMAVLAASIARHGMLQPIVVRRDGQAGRYVLVCGARRLLACRMLGLKRVDALLFEGSAQAAAACFLEEHATRKQPHFLDEAHVIEQAGAEDVQSCCVLSACEIVRRMHMMALDEETLAQIRRGGLSLEQAEPLLSVPDAARRREAASIIAERGLTPRQARRLILPPVSSPSADGEDDACKGTSASKRRAIREAMEAADAIARQLSARGMAATVAMHSQDRGVCIQIFMKNPETPMQEKAAH